MFTASDYNGVCAQVKEVLGEFWRDFEIDEIISRAYKFDGEEYTCVVDENEFWEIAAECDKCETECVNALYDYRAAVRGDIREAVTGYDLSKFETREGAYESLCDDFWILDAVTGNASGSYTFSAWRAESYLAHNWGLLADALSQLGYTDSGVNILEKGAERCDSLVRCYLLSECLNVVLDELESVGVAKWNR